MHFCVLEARTGPPPWNGIKSDAFACPPHNKFRVATSGIVPVSSDSGRVRIPTGTEPTEASYVSSWPRTIDTRWSRCADSYPVWCSGRQTVNIAQRVTGFNSMARIMERRFTGMPIKCKPNTPTCSYVWHASSNRSFRICSLPSTFMVEHLANLSSSGSPRAARTCESRKCVAAFKKS